MAMLVGCGGSGADGPAGTSTGPEAGTSAASTGVDMPTASSSTGMSSSSEGSEGTTSADSTGEGPAFLPGENALIPVFEGAHIFWLGWDEGQNQRELDFEVELPEPGFTYESVTLTLRLSCPDGLCDWWDRKGSIGLVAEPGREEPPVWELARFVTPYRVGGTWTLDVTALQTLLTGQQTLRLYIDTWVGPGHANGDGWIVDAQLEYTGGVPDLVPTRVIPLWPRQQLTLGDPLNPLPDQLAAAPLEVPPEAAKVELWSVITGHGQGNLDNCAEFCQLAHGFLIADAPVQRTIWRDDCDQNPVSGQQGTWTLPRAGWCPGDMVQPWVEDITAHATAGTSVEVVYDVTGYENTCRPDAPVCMGCALGTGCEYDGGNHTPPEVQVSSAVIIYEESQP
ncbi:MAG: peptide-N-glycosidase F-related protein [Nannocystales bacterium]